jgi:SNF2 family DNA or RNA helicase
MEPAERKLILMTGTPLSTPLDAYAYTSFTNPDAYLSQKFFEAQHVEGRDMFDTVTGWKNEDQLNANFLFNSARVFRRDIDPNLPEVKYASVIYELDKSHKKAYDELAENALLECEGQRIGADTIQKLHIMLQQIIVGYEFYFPEGKPRQAARKKVKAFELIEQIMSELDGRKLIIYAYYQNTIKALKEFCKPWNAVEIYGSMTAKARENNLNSFTKDDKCQILIGQPLSMGSGLDSLKNVCRDILFLELPMVPKDFTQAVGRIDRNGQTEICRVRVACAKGTLQVRKQAALLAKDEEANRVQHSYKDLRDWLFGA